MRWLRGPAEPHQWSFSGRKGAFTGAQNAEGTVRRPGGTLFLDGSATSTSPQIKLLVTLRAEVQRLGGAGTLKANRLVPKRTRTRKAIANGTFREDLYYRLNVFTFFAPCAAEVDLLLADRFLGRSRCAQQGHQAYLRLRLTCSGITGPETCAKQNTLERAVLWSATAR